jgi:hypothetical protein
MNLFNYAGTDISQETASVEPSNMQPNFQQPFYSNSTPTCYAQTMNNDERIQRCCSRYQ